jgi:hypothetical protein
MEIDVLFDQHGRGGMPDLVGGEDRKADFVADTRELSLRSRSAAVGAASIGGDSSRGRAAYPFHVPLPTYLASPLTFDAKESPLLRQWRWGEVVHR